LRKCARSRGASAGRTRPAVRLLATRAQELLDHVLILEEDVARLVATKVAYLMSLRPPPGEAKSSEW
jgi:hypothetical protein